MKELFDDPNDTNSIYLNANYLRNRLQEKYGSNIFLTDKHKNETFMCFKASVYSVLNVSWQSNRKIDAEEESIRFVKTAAEMLMIQLRFQLQNLKLPIQ